MYKRSSFLKAFGNEIADFFKFYFSYNKKKVVAFSVWFEKNKNRLIKFFLMKRGRYNRPFLHIATMGVLLVGVLIAPFLADTYPIFASKASALDLNDPSAQKQSVQVDEDVFGTKVSNKPRDKVINYTVEKGDTIGTIAQKFGISEDTIKWENDLSGNTISIGDELKILPVTGIAHKVESGDTVYSIAKKYNSNPQAIVDWDFNDFANPETFSLVVGQMLIVPDGIKPSEQPFIKRQTQFADGPVPVSSGGFTFPMRGGIMQYFSWFHPGIDIATGYGTPIVAAHSGTVTRVSVGTYDTGYGNNVWISKGDGVESHYAHLSSVNVSVGQHVVGGSTVIGAEGSTGRSTGPHLHFEIRQNGTLVNPLSYVQ
jgi:murein DD-endopeptidase MepM/ murein hydrolase activator NlpD